AVSAARAFALDARAAFGLTCSGARDLELAAFARRRLRFDVALRVDVAVRLTLGFRLERRAALARRRLNLERRFRAAARLERGVDLGRREVAPELHPLDRIAGLVRVRVGAADLRESSARAGHAVERSARRAREIGRCLSEGGELSFERRVDAEVDAGEIGA